MKEFITIASIVLILYYTFTAISIKLTPPEIAYEMDETARQSSVIEAPPRLIFPQKYTEQ